MRNPHPHLTWVALAAANSGDDAGLERVLAAIDAEGEKDRASIDARLGAPDALGRAAEFYAGHGWPVFLLAPFGKRPITKNGLKDATTDVDLVSRLWERHETANIGVRTGPAPDGCGYDIIDLDGALGVTSWYGEDLPGAPQVLARSRTTRPGGWHLWVAATGRGNRAGMLPGVDYRGAGGYVVAPPSRRLVDGTLRRWTWVDVPADLTRPDGAA